MRTARLTSEFPTHPLLHHDEFGREQDVVRPALLTTSRDRPNLNQLQYQRSGVKDHRDDFGTWSTYKRRGSVPGRFFAENLGTLESADFGPIPTVSVNCLKLSGRQGAHR